MNQRLVSAINDFCLREYGNGADFENPKNVSFLYTTVCCDELEDAGDPGDEVELQICIDMTHLRALYYFGAGPGLVEEYDSADGLAEAVEDSDFQSWYSSALEAYRFSGYYKKDWEFSEEDDR